MKEIERAFAPSFFWHSYLRTLSLTEIYIGFDIYDNPDSIKYWLNEPYETVVLNSCSHLDVTFCILYFSSTS